MKAFLALAGTAMLALAFMTSCSSTGPRVLERVDGVSDKPEWASETRPSYEEDGNKYFLGYVELSGDVSKSAALNMADEKALSEPMRALVDQFLDQNQVGENLRKEGSMGQRIISASRSFRAPMPSLTIVRHYWEVVAYDEYNTTLRAYTLAEVPKKDFEQAKNVYLERLAGNSEMKQILRDVGRRQRDNILGPEATAKTVAKEETKD